MTEGSTVHYQLPDYWIRYDHLQILGELVEAKAVIKALRGVPYQRDWVDRLQKVELKREIAGTSRIEGADFTERELDEAISEGPSELLTRSQRQARAAESTYRWLGTIPDDQPITTDLIKDIHRRIVTGADDDHCRPGELRRSDENVTFGQPQHRGVSGGPECETAMQRFVEALGNEYRGHDPLIQALAAHYHLAAMHPFLDGNGRTARALGALLKQRAGLRDTCFIAVSNYYYDEKREYLSTLSEARSLNHDLTPFLKFALRGVALQAGRVLQSVQVELNKVVYRDLMHDLFGRLKTPKRRVIAERQMQILGLLLDVDSIEFSELVVRAADWYSGLHNPVKAVGRDVVSLASLGALRITEHQMDWKMEVNLDWPREMSESEFLKKLKGLPKAKRGRVEQ